MIWEAEKLMERATSEMSGNLVFISVLLCDPEPLPLSSMGVGPLAMK